MSSKIWRKKCAKEYTRLSLSKKWKLRQKKIWNSESLKKVCVSESEKYRWCELLTATVQVCVWLWSDDDARNIATIGLKMTKDVVRMYGCSIWTWLISSVWCRVIAQAPNVWKMAGMEREGAEAIFWQNNKFVENSKLSIFSFHYVSAVILFTF